MLFCSFRHTIRRVSPVYLPGCVCATSACLKKDTNSHFQAQLQLNKFSWLMPFWQGRGEERNYRQHTGHADKDKLRDPSAGHCGGNVPIHIIDKRISDLFIKPTARRETESLSRRCRRTLSTNQSRLNGANMNGALRGWRGWQPVHCMAKRASHVPLTRSHIRGGGCTNRVSMAHACKGVGGRSSGYSSHHYRCHHLLRSVCTSSHTSES